MDAKNKMALLMKSPCERNVKAKVLSEMPGISFSPKMEGSQSCLNNSSNEQACCH